MFPPGIACCIYLILLSFPSFDLISWFGVGINFSFSRHDKTALLIESCPAHTGVLMLSCYIVELLGRYIYTSLSVCRQNFLFCVFKSPERVASILCGWLSDEKISVGEKMPGRSCAGPREGLLRLVQLASARVVCRVARCLKLKNVNLCL